MKNSNLILCLITAISLFSSVSTADEIAIIINKENTQKLSLNEVKHIYSDNINFWKNGSRIQILNAPVNSSARNIFSKKVLGLSVQQAMATEANKKITNSLKNPTETKRERLIVSIISKKPNAIGYVSKAIAESKSKIKILMIIK